MKTFVAKLLMKAGLAALLVTVVADAAFAQSDTKASKKVFEVIESAGLNVPDPLTPQSIESFVDENIVTTSAGRLLVTKSIDLSAICTPTSGVLYYLMVDDVPVRSSATFSRTTGITGQLTGVTEDIVLAGRHHVRVGEQCTLPGATVSGGSVTLVGVTSIIVLP